MAVLRTLTLNGTKYEVESSLANVRTVTLPSNLWTGSGSKYSQNLTLSGITTKTKIDIQPTEDLVNILYVYSFGLYIENNEGVARVFAYGAKPSIDLTVQLTLSEVEVE